MVLISIIILLLLELFAIGENDDVAIGFVPKDYPQKRLPGWMPNSVGFHVAKGQLVVLFLSLLRYFVRKIQPRCYVDFSVFFSTLCILYII